MCIGGMFLLENENVVCSPFSLRVRAALLVLHRRACLLAGEPWSVDLAVLRGNPNRGGHADGAGGTVHDDGGAVLEP